MNTITLIGRAGRDPEVRYFESGSMVANLSLAVNAFKRDEDPDWFNLTIWGKQAQVAADYVRKGQQIAVTGRMTTEKWTDKGTGEERSKPIVVVDRIELLGSKRDAEQGDSWAGADATPAPAPAPAQRPAAAAPATRQAPARPAPTPTPISDEEIPF